MKAKESHPMHGAVIFRMKGQCTLLSPLKSALSQQVLDSNFKTRSSKVSRIENRVSSLETRVTVNLLLSGTVVVFSVQT